MERPPGSTDDRESGAGSSTLPQNGTESRKIRRGLAEAGMNPRRMDDEQADGRPGLLPKRPIYRYAWRWWWLRNAGRHWWHGGWRCFRAYFKGL